MNRTCDAIMAKRQNNQCIADEFSMDGGLEVDSRTSWPIANRVERWLFRFTTTAEVQKRHLRASGRQTQRVIDPRLVHSRRRKYAFQPSLKKKAGRR